MMKLTNNNTLDAIDRETMKDKLLSQVDVQNQNNVLTGTSLITQAEGGESSLIKTSIYGSVVACSASSLVYSDMNANYTRAILDGTWCKENEVPFVQRGDLKASPKMPDGTQTVSQSGQYSGISDEPFDLSASSSVHRVKSDKTKGPSSMDHLPRVIQCLACNMTFPSLDAYTDHYQEYHTSVVLASEATVLEDCVPEDSTHTERDHTVPEPSHRHPYQTHSPVTSTAQHQYGHGRIFVTDSESKMHLDLELRQEEEYSQQLTRMLSGDDILSLAMLSTDIKPLAFEKDTDYTTETAHANTLNTSSMSTAAHGNRTESLYRLMEKQLEQNPAPIPHRSSLEHAQARGDGIQSNSGSHTMDTLPSFYQHITQNSAYVSRQSPISSPAGVFQTKLDLPPSGSVPSPTDTGSPDGSTVISPIAFINIPEVQKQPSEDLSTISSDMVTSLGLPMSTRANHTMKDEPLFTEAQLAKLASDYIAKPDEIAQIAAAMYSMSDRQLGLTAAASVEYHADQMPMPMPQHQPQPQPQEPRTTAAQNQDLLMPSPSTPTPMEFAPPVQYPPPEAASRTDHELFSCPKCDSVFQKRHLLTKHIQVYHRNPISTKGPSTLYCRVCGRGFGRLDSLNSHVEGHLVEDTTSNCPVCNVVIHDRQVLVKHIQDHPTRKPFECSMCGKKFSITSSLKKHLKRYHGEDE